VLPPAATLAQSTPASQPAPTASPVAPTKAPIARALVIYSGRSEALVGPIIKQYSQATGIEVQVKYGPTGALAATLLEEGSRSPADVYFAQDPGDLGAVRALFAGLPQDILDTVPGWARSPEGKWVGISGRARVVAYNTERLTEPDLPDSIEGFTDPKWKGKIGWAPTNASFQAMVGAMRIVWGEERASLWVKGIQSNQPKVFPNNLSIVNAVATGEIDAGFVNHYYLRQLIAEKGEGVKARNYFTRSKDPGAVVLVAGAGVLATSQNRGAAEKFLQFMLSAPAQQYFASQTYEFPLVSGVAKDRLLPDLDKIQRPDIDLSRLDDVKGTQALLRAAGAIP
jgi:iron(III) transport system substrate-binding protein